MRANPRRWLPTAYRFVLACAFALAFGAGPALAQADATSANLSGVVRDPAGAVVAGAAVTARNPSVGVTRTTTTNDEGFYQLVQLAPGAYEVTVEAANFKKAVVPSVTVTVGQRADLDIALELGQITDVVTVTGAQTELIETSKTNVSNTVDQVRIENLPINQRDYINFTLTTSTVTRDNGRPIGPAPTSGLNFGGQRGRSNLVQVDGADNTDNSVNAARSTVSQEAVQEFQVVTNSFAPEFGRTAGGVVNVVTKSGTNDVRGNVFGFIRHKSIQAKNPFAPIIDNDPDKKPPFTRAQYGATLGFPLDRDRTFGFIAFEQRKRQESGFFTSDVVQRLTASATIPAIPGVNPVGRVFTRLTQQQRRARLRLLRFERRQHGSHGDERAADDPQRRQRLPGHQPDSARPPRPGHRPALPPDGRARPRQPERLPPAPQPRPRLPHLGGHDLLVGAARPPHQRPQRPDAALRLQPLGHHGHSGRVAEPGSGPERLLAHGHPGPARRELRHDAPLDALEHDGQRGALQLRAAPRHLRLAERAGDRLQHHRRRLHRPRAVLARRPHREPLRLHRQPELGRRQPHLQVRRRRQLHQRLGALRAELRRPL
jgi:hypothetical protein